MTRMVTPSWVVHGPQGCGKSVNAQRIARKLGLGQVVDDWHWGQPMPKTGALVLTCEPPPPDLPHHRVMSFKEAMRACGFDRSPSTTRQPL